MRFSAILAVILLSVTLAFAGDKCGGSMGCGGCKSKCGPESAYSYNDPHYMPDCAPGELHDFQSKLIPVMEARKSGESSFIRDNAACLYRMSKQVLKADDCCPQMKTKMYRGAAKDLVKDCKRLKDLAYGSPSDVIYAKVKNIEDDFVRLANLCD